MTPGLARSSFRHEFPPDSAAVGRSCVHAAADSNFKKLGLELGGKNPIIVFADSNLEDAADGAAFGISFNSGQCCVSASRLIVERSVAAEFERILVAKMAKIIVGDPLDEGTQVGAITTDAQNATIMDYIAKGQAEGARLLTGGTSIDLGHGQYIAPTLFSGVSPDMSIAREEIFGPVLSSFHFDTVEEAITLANDTVYGLSGYVQSENLDHAREVAKQIRAGMIHINGASTDPAPANAPPGNESGREAPPLRALRRRPLRAPAHAPPGVATSRAIP